jgi:hypothetical protein
VKTISMSGKGNQEVAAQAAVGEGERTITLIKRLARPPGFKSSNRTGFGTDRLLAREIAKALREENYAVDVAANGEDGQHLGNSEAYDVAFLARITALMSPMTSPWLARNRIWMKWPAICSTMHSNGPAGKSMSMPALRTETYRSQH